MKVLSLIMLLVVSVAGVATYQFSRFGVDSPEYEVIGQEGDIEIRSYPRMALVSTPMPDPDVNEGSSFGRLFRYISGANEARQEIAMTTPVIEQRSDGKATMSFIVPAEVAATGAPLATVEDVVVTEMPGGQYAAYRFGGTWDPETVEAATTTLLAWVKSRERSTLDEPIVARYDPPFTPRFLRRNEILVRLAP